MGNESRANLAVFASGTGTLFESIVEAQKSGELPIDKVVLLVDRENSGAAKRAERLKVDCEMMAPQQFQSFDEWDSACSEWLQSLKINFVVLAGFLRKVGPKVLDAVDGRMVNTHPSLLPKYGGKGMFGSRVHAAVIANGEKESGCTVHWVNHVYDDGAIIAQKKVQVESQDTPESLAGRVKSVENPFLIAVLKSMLSEKGS